MIYGDYENMAKVAAQLEKAKMQKHIDELNGVIEKIGKQENNK